MTDFTLKYLLSWISIFIIFCGIYYWSVKVIRKDNFNQLKNILEKHTKFTLIFIDNLIELLSKSNNPDIFKLFSSSLNFNLIKTFNDNYIRIAIDNEHQLIIKPSVVNKFYKNIIIFYKYKNFRNTIYSIDSSILTPEELLIAEIIE